MTSAVATRSSLLDRLDSRLAELVAVHRVPGASIAVLANGKVTEAATGVTSLATGVEVTPETLFQIGSITKVHTSVLILQLADEGRLDLDAPVRTYLPDFELADAGAADAVTIRHLLTHTSGIDADLADFGRGDDCVARYVASLQTAPVLWQPGTAYSYCNPGFIILGRVVEVLREATWDAALAEHLLVPLGLTRTVTLPEDALLFRAAVGHEPSGESIEVAKQWMLPRSCGPAGLICGTAADLIEFAAMHIRGGRAADGAVVLSEASTLAMRQKHAEMDYRDNSAGQGLGWGILDWNGAELVSHGGGTMGQLAYLTVHVPSGTAVALLTNGPSKPMYDQLFAELFAELAGLSMPAAPQPGYSGADGGRLDGLYRGGGQVMEVLGGGDSVRAAWWPGSGPEERPAESDLEWVDLQRAGEHEYLVPEPRSRAFAEIVFTDFGSDRYSRRVYVAGRAACRLTP